jgi:peptidoglycan/xylan/chitin deacetylase (PgdA/CDA1 family)
MTKKFILSYLLIIIFLNSNSYGENNRYFEFDKGIIALMYHRFDEHKYPSTNIQMDIFKEQINIIENLKINFLHPKNLNEEILKPNKVKKILFTIDDGFQSFYDNAWPILKKKNIPFILFISTAYVGKKGYMNWEQIKEVEKSGLGIIGNHSHTHEYLVDQTNNQIINDINRAIKLFEKKLGHSPKYFSYPFGEYSNDFKKILKNLNFNIAFGQHSGMIDSTKNSLEFPRFPINEKYGNLDRFKFILNLLPFPYKKIYPENRYLQESENPPELKIVFFENQKNLRNINCFSNEGNRWRDSKIKLGEENTLVINFEEKFTSERGRINCSLNDKNGWRWLGIQYVISEY